MYGSKTPNDSHCCLSSSRADRSALLHPSAVVQAWPAEDEDGDGDDDDDDNDHNVPETAPTSTTPPVSPGRRRALPICSPLPGICPFGGGSAKPEPAPRDIPRLAGLADYDMRVFLTE